MIDSSKPIAAGAQPFVLLGNDVALLIIHGYGGSIGDYRKFAELLHANGYTVTGMRLAGHGQGINALGKSDMADWRESVFKAARALRPRVKNLFLLGASFGGSLAIDYAAHAGPAVSGLILVNALLAYGRGRLTRAGLKLLKTVSPNLPKFGLNQAAKRQYAWLGSTTAWPVGGLIETEKFLRTFVVPALPRIMVPVFIMKNSADPYVPVSNAKDIYHALGSAEKQLVTIPGQTHRPFRDPAMVDFMARQTHHFIQEIIAKKAV